MDKIIKRDIGRRQNVHAGDAARSGDLRLPHHAPLPVERRVARGHAAVELHGDDGQLRLVQIAAQRTDKLRKAGKIGLRCVFVALGLALVPEHGLRVQLVICKLLKHIEIQRTVFLRVPPAQRRAAVGAHDDADGVAKLPLEELRKVQPRRMAGVVVLKVSLMDRAGRLAQRMRRQIPDAGIAQQMHAKLRRVLYRVLCASGGVALPGDDEHVADADVVDHIAPR